MLRRYESLTEADVAEIEAFLRRDAGVHVYEIGDLDPFFRARTRWFGWHGDGLEALCLLYMGSTPPTLVAICPPEHADITIQLLTALDDHLPAQVYGHVSPHLVSCFAARWTVRARGPHLKMMLTDPAAVHAANTGAVVAATNDDVATLTAFYDEAYPGHWFDARMLATGQYRGIREAGRWVAAAGVHVYSAAHRVAALGNIATGPSRRRQGLGRTVTAAVCASLLTSVDVIGLNVLADNAAARSCYEGLGFTYVCQYDEVLLDRRA